MEENLRVYTIAEESKYVLVTGIPPYHLETEFVSLCNTHGQLLSLQQIPNTDKTQQNAVLLTFKDYLQAKKTKKAMHKRVFYGMEVKFRYQPEMESVADTLAKLELYESQFNIPAKPSKPPNSASSPAPIKRRRI